MRFDRRAEWLVVISGVGLVPDLANLECFVWQAVLVNFALPAEGCAISIEGTAQDDGSFECDPEILVSGSPHPNDKIYIHFTGNAQFCAYANDLSTVDAEGNWRTKSYSLQVTALGSNITTGDGKAYFAVPTELDGWRLETAAFGLDVASTNGVPAFQLRRVRAGTPTDMLTTKLTVDQDEYHSSDGVAAVPDTSSDNDNVETGDRIYFDCDVAGTGAQGAQAYLTFRRW